MKKLLILLLFLNVGCEKFFNGNQSQGIFNGSEEDMYFYIHCYDIKGETFPAYDDLTDKPIMILAKGGKEIYIYFPYAPSFDKGALLYVYAFSPDTLERYTWEEILQEKRYWFCEKNYNFKISIQFPDEFEYMGEQ